MEVIYPRLADGADTVFSFLLLAGYLTPASDPEETEIGTFTSLRIPNMEIRRVYNTEILAFMKIKTAGSVITEIERAIYLGDGDRLAKALENYMASCISYFDGSAEGFYHGMIQTETERWRHQGGTRGFRACAGKYDDGCLQTHHR